MWFLLVVFIYFILVLLFLIVWIYHDGYIMDIWIYQIVSEILLKKWRTEHKTWHLLLVKYGAMLNFDVFLCYYLKNYVGIPPQEGGNHRIYIFSRMTTSENCWGDLTHFIHYCCTCAWLFFVIYPIKWIWLQFSVFKWEA